MVKVTYNDIYMCIVSANTSENLGTKLL